MAINKYKVEEEAEDGYGVETRIVNTGYSEEDAEVENGLSSENA